MLDSTQEIDTIRYVEKVSKESILREYRKGTSGKKINVDSRIYK